MGLRKLNELKRLVETSKSYHQPLKFEKMISRAIDPLNEIRELQASGLDLVQIEKCTYRAYKMETIRVFTFQVDKAMIDRWLDHRETFGSCCGYVSLTCEYIPK